MYHYKNSAQLHNWVVDIRYLLNCESIQKLCQYHGEWVGLGMRGKRYGSLHCLHSLRLAENAKSKIMIQWGSWFKLTGIHPEMYPFNLNEIEHLMPSEDTFRKPRLNNSLPLLYKECFIFTTRKWEQSIKQCSFFCLPLPFLHTVSPIVKWKRIS